MQPRQGSPTLKNPIRNEYGPTIGTMGTVRYLGVTFMTAPTAAVQ
jgi:hypothetical protein